MSVNNRFFYLYLALLLLLASGCASDTGAKFKWRITSPHLLTTAPSPTPSNTPTTTAIPTLIPTDTPTTEPTPIPSPTIPGPPSQQHLIPNSEIIFSASAADFDTAAYLDQAGGFLGTYRQYLMITAWTDAPAVVDMVAIENSINPRLLVALLEYQCGCVLGMNEIDPDEFTSAMGATQALRQDLYGQLIWAIHEISEGYYGWKDGTLTEISFSDGKIIHPESDLNAGSFALMYLFSLLYEGEDWERACQPQRRIPRSLRANVRQRLGTRSPRRAHHPPQHHPTRTNATV